MPTAPAKLLPAIPEDPGSDQNLDSVGPLAVLGAMVEQKKRSSRPAREEVEEIHGVIDDEDDGSADETQPRKVPQYSDAFLKVR